jgi:hypothetical protein
MRIQDFSMSLGVAEKVFMVASLVERIGASSVSPGRGQATTEYIVKTAY